MSNGIKEVAQACGLSANTVSDILNRGKQHLYRPETRDRVLQVATELNYRPNRAARSMRSQHSQAVGFLAFNMSSGNNSAADVMLENYTVYPFVVGMSHYFTDRGFHVSLVEMKEMQANIPGQLPDILRERYFDGLVVHYGIPQALRDLLVQHEVPVVWWDTGIFDEFNCIYRDETAVTRQLTRQLIELGHRRIAFTVGQTGWEKYQLGQPSHFSYAQRYEAYLAEMAAHGLEPLRIVGYDSEGVTQQLRDQQISALITMGNNRLQNLTGPCLNLGWRIPEDLTVASIDIEMRIRHNAPVIGGMTYDRYDAGQRAAAMLYSKIERPNEPVPNQLLHGEFIGGDTIAVNK